MLIKLRSIGLLFILLLGTSTFGQNGATHCHSIGSGSYMIGNTQLGTRCSYHQNGRLSQETPYAHGVIHGTMRKYWDNGNKREEHPYWNGQRNGTKYAWRKDGIRLETINYVDGRKHGEARSFSNNGNLSRCSIYNHGSRTGSCSQ